MSQFELLPSTRYLGSKRKLLPALQAVLSSVSFESAADPFCGSGAVAYLLKTMNKHVLASDVLNWNVICTSALLGEPDFGFLPALEKVLVEIENIAFEHHAAAPGFIECHFEGLFYTSDENRFMDRYISAVADWSVQRRQFALHVLFQAALAKRPYNLFHRANLYMRQQQVQRSFGNKTTWDTPFNVLVRRYAEELCTAWFGSSRKVSVCQRDVNDADFTGVDLVYLDPPYMPKKGMGVDYLDYYHLLEGIALDDNALWRQKLLHRYKHKPLAGRGENPFCSATRITGAFESVIEKCADATIVLSYRSDGIPDVATLVAMLRHIGKRVTVVDCGKYIYALSRNAKSREVILVAE